MTNKANTTLFKDFQANLSVNGVTPILMWDKPKKVRTVQEWKDHYGFEDGPDGGFMPNMSTSDQEKWKAKLVGTTTGYPQVEIRKTVGCQMTIIVNLGAGYNYKYYQAVNEKCKDQTIKEIMDEFKSIGMTRERAEERKYPTKGINVHLALNGPAQMTFDEMQEMNQAIAEAKTCLELLKKQGI